MRPYFDSNTRGHLAIALYAFWGASLLVLVFSVSDPDMCQELVKLESSERPQYYTTRCAKLGDDSQYSWGYLAYLIAPVVFVSLLLYPKALDLLSRPEVVRKAVKFVVPSIAVHRRLILTTVRATTVFIIISAAGMVAAMNFSGTVLVYWIIGATGVAVVEIVRNLAGSTDFSHLGRTDVPIEARIAVLQNAHNRWTWALVLATSKSGTLLLRRDQGEMAVL